MPGRRGLQNEMIVRLERENLPPSGHFESLLPALVFAHTEEELGSNRLIKLLVLAWVAEERPAPPNRGRELRRLLQKKRSYPSHRGHRYLSQHTRSSTPPSLPPSLLFSSPPKVDAARSMRHAAGNGVPSSWLPTRYSSFARRHSGRPRCMLDCRSPAGGHDSFLLACASAHLVVEFQ